MNPEQLQQLLSQPESTTLEFKRKAYELDHKDSDFRKKQKHELIKDILSLANGNATTVGEKAYLIIGADDTFQADGNRTLYDIDPSGLGQQRILQIVNSACAPRLQDIECHLLEIEGKRLYIITIWPTPHLHETTRELKTTQSTYSPYVVFIRHNENIALATAKEREAIQKLKQLHFADTRKAPPAKFGAFVGAVVGGIMAGGIPPDKHTKPKPARVESKTNGS